MHSSVSRLKRVPACLAAHVDVRQELHLHAQMPSPSQASQRPPFTFEEKREAS